MLYLNMSRLSGKPQITLPNSDLEKKKVVSGLSAVFCWQTLALVSL